jgi:hypothetical protein
MIALERDKNLSKPVNKSAAFFFKPAQSEEQQTPQRSLAMMQQAGRIDYELPRIQVLTRDCKNNKREQKLHGLFALRKLKRMFLTRKCRD